MQVKLYMHVLTMLEGGGRRGGGERSGIKQHINMMR